ncbi:MAG: hypothetical protein D3915_08890 [Candidatus Electrothrix sp. AU1_5]|nr:hypothetical protein [Candidatus Electrothrix gigas]
MYSRKIKKTRRLTGEGEKKRIYTVYKGEGEGISALQSIIIHVNLIFLQKDRYIHAAQQIY